MEVSLHKLSKLSWTSKCACSLFTVQEQKKSIIFFRHRYHVPVCVLNKYSIIPHWCLKIDRSHWTNSHALFRKNTRTHVWHTCTVGWNYHRYGLGYTIFISILSHTWTKAYRKLKLKKKALLIFVFYIKNSIDGFFPTEENKKHNMKIQ